MILQDNQASHSLVSTMISGSISLEKKIDFLTRDASKPYFGAALRRLSKVNPENTNIICDYIAAELTEINIKQSTKEGKIKVLIWLSNFYPGKSFQSMQKNDLLQYLNSLRKP